MLQRAASNAYSWWWASNMRTRQSKWLDNNLQEMEEKVKSMINLIEEDADTFAQKAAMYYQRRPVLINFVEEAYRAYKALADRYDHISGELHKANHTIATAFPDQVQLPMQDDDDEGSPKAAVIDSSKLVKPSAVIQTIGAINKYSENQSFIKKPRPRFAASPIDKDKAQEEIDRLQKEILVLQTEKEFIKSTYESGLAKYLEIEKQITEMQEDVSYLQDEFSASVVIEDDDARALMAATALKSCEETLVSLQEQQKRSTEEARIESDRIREAKQKLKALKKDYGQPQIDTGESDKSEVSSTIMEEEVCSLKQERLGLQSVCERVKEHLQMSSDTSVVELAEKIDELVDKVISLEFTVSSQNAQITRLKSQTDELQNHLQVLEEDKAALIDDSNILSDQLKQAEEELHRAQDLEKSVRDEKVMLQTHFTEAYHSLNDLSEKLHTPRHQDQINATISLQDKENERIQSTADKLVSSKQSHVDSEADSQLPVDSENVQLPNEECGLGELYSQREFKEPKDYSELDGKEKILLEDYTSMLQNYKETKKKLSELEKKSQDSIFEMIVQMRDLKRANARMDEELQALRQKLGSPQTTPSENADSSPDEGPRPRHLKSRSLYSFLTEDRYRESKKLDATFFTDSSSHRIDDIKLSNIEEPQTSSVIEAKFRRDMDMLLEENLDFWLRFCTSYHQIQKFKTTFEELEAEIEKLKDGKKQDGGGTAAVEQAAKQGSEPTEKKLRELNTELQVWLEQNTSLKMELKSRSTSLSNIQEEIARVLKECEAYGAEFPPYQAAKIQGEVINMQQENHKVAIELQAGLDNARELQVEVGRALSKLHDSFELSASNSHHQSQHSRHLLTMNRVPLRTFLFGNKPKKSSIFSCMNPAVRKHYNSMRQHGVPQ